MIFLRSTGQPWQIEILTLAIGFALGYLVCWL